MFYIHDAIVKDLKKRKKHHLWVRIKAEETWVFTDTTEKCEAIITGETCHTSFPLDTESRLLFK